LAVLLNNASSYAAMIESQQTMKNITVRGNLLRVSENVSEDTGRTSRQADFELKF
jgi:hypothetical protein